MKLHWGNAIFIFFTIFIGLSITFVIFSLNQDIELVEDDYYDKGANYTQQMLITQRSSIYFDSINVKNNTQNIMLELAQGIYNSADTLMVHFYNPSSKSKDYKLLLTNLSDTLYIDKTNVSSGHYTIKINWHLAELEYLVEKTIDIN